jgi:hypothetical protein
LCPFAPLLISHTSLFSLARARVRIQPRRLSHAALYLSPGGKRRCVKAIPGAVDMYVLHRGKLAIETAAAGFSRETIGQDQMLAISAVLATHLELIRGELQGSAERLKKSQPHDAAVFSAAASSLSGNSAVLVAAIKAFAAAPTPEARATALLFTRPILVSIDTLIEYGSDARFAGTPPKVCARGGDSHVRVPSEHPCPSR